VASSGFSAAGASASQLISNVPTRVDTHTSSIKVNKKGLALLTFKANGRVQHILARGAINARSPSKTVKQVRFKLDYKGGWGFFHDAKYWKNHFGRNICGPYKPPANTPPDNTPPPTETNPGDYTQGDDTPQDDTPSNTPPEKSYKLDRRILIYACTTPDGSHWALQSWQRRLRTYGGKNKAYNLVWELRLSHWNTELPKLEIKMDWQSWGTRGPNDPFGDRHYDHLWGRFTYLGKPVYGFKATRVGAPLDDWGRNVYLDTFKSPYGGGWKHENAFLTHDPTGNFCYVVTKHPPHPAGIGEKYRATVVGPGVAPDVTWEGPSPGRYDPVLDLQANAQQHLDLAGDSSRWQGNNKCAIR
jgi:hypothetical protein